MTSITPQLPPLVYDRTVADLRNYCIAHDKKYSAHQELTPAESNLLDTFKYSFDYRVANKLADWCNYLDEALVAQGIGITQQHFKSDYTETSIVYLEDFDTMRTWLKSLESKLSISDWQRLVDVDTITVEQANAIEFDIHLALATLERLLATAKVWCGSPTAICGMPFLGATSAAKYMLLTLPKQNNVTEFSNWQYDQRKPSFDVDSKYCFVEQPIAQGKPVGIYSVKAIPQPDVMWWDQTREPKETTWRIVPATVTFTESNSPVVLSKDTPRQSFTVKYTSDAPLKLVSSTNDGIVKTQDAMFAKNYYNPDSTGAGKDVTALKVGKASFTYELMPSPSGNYSNKDVGKRFTFEVIVESI